MKRVTIWLTVASLSMVIAVAVLCAPARPDKPYFSVRFSRGNRGDTWFRYTLHNPTHLDCLVSIAVGDRELTNVLVLSGESVDVGVPGQAANGRPKTKLTGVLANEKPLINRMMQSLGLWQNRSSLFGRTNSEFLLKERDG